MAEPGSTQYWAILPDGKWHEVPFDVYEERRQHYQTLAVKVPPVPTYELGAVLKEMRARDPDPPTVCPEAPPPGPKRDRFPLSGRRATGGRGGRPSTRPKEIGYAGTPSFARNGAESPGYLENESRLNWWLPELTAKQHAAIARFDADCLEAELEERYKPWRAKWGYRPLFDGLRDPDPLELKKSFHWRRRH